GRQRKSSVGKIWNALLLVNKKCKKEMTNSIVKMIIIIIIIVIKNKSQNMLVKKVYNVRLLTTNSACNRMF
ncbi:MAG: AICAR transformylase/IMP cyclohydrolase PurH, partial [Bacillariaceae sp.]